MMRLALFLIMLLPSFAYGVDAYFKHYVLFSPEEGNYVETHIKFNAASLALKQEDEGFQEAVELTYIFENAGAVTTFSKKLVKSPFTETAEEVADFIDMQRFFVPSGTYDLKIKIRDMNNTTDTVAFSQPVVVEDRTEEIFFSDVIFIESVADNTGEQTIYTRGNKEMIPRISSYQSPNNDKAQFYAELYNTDIKLGENEAYLLNIDVIDMEKDQVISAYHVMQRANSSNVLPIFHQYDISELPTGNYMVKLEARDRNNQVLAARSIPMQRHSLMPSADSLSNEQIAKTFVSKIHGEDSLRNMTYCLIYQGSTSERQYIEKNWEEGDTTELRRFFYQYWIDRNPLDPKASWKMYHEKIAYVEKEFDVQRRHGCATDRGRIYLTYGKPNTRARRPSEPNAYPYEIWHYYKTKKKSNAKFVLIDKTLVTNDYKVLHSNIPGEIYDQNWFTQISTQNSNPMVTGVAQTSQEVMDVNNLNAFNLDEVGSRALDFWNNPR